MLAPERHRQILRLLAARGRLTAAEIRSRLGVSAATARRDFTDIAGAGLATRTRGGLLPHGFSLVEPPFPRKSERAVNAKARLGRAAAAILPEEGTIFVDAGTTCLEAGRALLDRPGLRIYTNSIPLLALAGDARATLCALGGEVRPVSLALTGALAQGWLDNLRFDAAVVGASGLDAASGASTTEVSEAAVKAEALRRATRRILVAHSEKWGRPAALRFAPWDAFSDLVTDRPLGREERAALQKAGVRVHPAPLS
ncbi:MAG TPA: DeoR/GlpR family DNA-binding transcription regulator [Opitutaceae bacterium]|jgi:DeoR/GlpR family transcriptional regulator of sugar metabolism